MTLKQLQSELLKLVEEFDSLSDEDKNGKPGKIVNNKIARYKHKIKELVSETGL